jgi:hypothetical protein
MPQGKHSTVQLDLGVGINQSLKPSHIARAYSELRCTFGGRSIVPIKCQEHFRVDDSYRFLHSFGEVGHSSSPKSRRCVTKIGEIANFHQKRARTQLQDGFHFSAKKRSHFCWLNGPEKRHWRQSRCELETLQCLVNQLKNIKSKCT